MSEEKTIDPYVVLFIGGPHDGFMSHIGLSEDLIRVPILADFDVGASSRTPIPPPPLRVEEHVYRLETVNTDHGDIRIMVSEDLSLAEALSKMIGVYSVIARTRRNQQ